MVSERLRALNVLFYTKPFVVAHVNKIVYMRLRNSANQSLKINKYL